MDGVALGGNHIALLVHRFTEYIEYASQHSGSHRHRDGCAGIHRHHAAPQAIRGAHGHGASPATGQVLLHFQGEPGGSAIHLVIHGESIVESRHLCAGKVNVDHGTDDLHNVS